LTYTVLFRPDAERDVEGAQDWYLLHAPEQADRFLDDLTETISSIHRWPRGYRALRRDARRATLRVFPYLVWFRVHEDEHVIEVLAVIHERQDAHRFRGRLR
jgi:plasmid stabilization system protein ParE